MGKKAQSGLEYLITYGWALIAIATIIGVLVFVASGGINTNTCTTFLALVCKGIGVDGDTLILVLQNATGQSITINPITGICFDGKCGYAVIVYNDERYRFEDVTIAQGEEFKIKAEGMISESEISITYTEEATGLEKTITSGMETEAKNQMELCNNSKDDDGDGLVDCFDPECETCTYVLTDARTYKGDPLPDEITVPSAIDDDFRNEELKLVYFDLEEIILNAYGASAEDLDEKLDIANNIIINFFITDTKIDCTNPTDAPPRAYIDSTISKEIKWENGNIGLNTVPRILDTPTPFERFGKGDGGPACSQESSYEYHSEWSDFCIYAKFKDRYCWFKFGTPIVELTVINASN